MTVVFEGAEKGKSWKLVILSAASDFSPNGSGLQSQKRLNFIFFDQCTAACPLRLPPIDLIHHDCEHALRHTPTH